MELNCEKHTWTISHISRSRARWNMLNHMLVCTQRSGEEGVRRETDKSTRVKTEKELISVMEQFSCKVSDRWESLVHTFCQFGNNSNKLVNPSNRKTLKHFSYRENQYGGFHAKLRRYLSISHRQGKESEMKNTMKRGDSGISYRKLTHFNITITFDKSTNSNYIDWQFLR